MAFLGKRPANGHVGKWKVLAHRSIVPEENRGVSKGCRGHSWRRDRRRRRRRRTHWTRLVSDEITMLFL